MPVEEPVEEPVEAESEDVSTVPKMAMGPLASIAGSAEPEITCRLIVERRQTTRGC